MTLASIVIPVASYHTEIAEVAIASAQAQTVKCEVILVRDESSAGAGATRNRGAAQARGLFTVFLDADDQLAPTFVEACLAVYRPGHYVMTGWLEGSRVRMPAGCVFADNGYHLVTTLYPTAAFRALGGFREQLPAHEDVDFYLRSARMGICPLLVNKPLLTYTHYGKRSQLFLARPDYHDIRRDIYEVNGGREATMGCCGDGTGVPAALIANGDARQEGDVLAFARWAGIRTEGSVRGNRVYRAGNNQKVWIYPDDLAMRPDLWQLALDPYAVTPNIEAVLALAGGSE